MEKAGSAPAFRTSTASHAAFCVESFAAFSYFIIVFSCRAVSYNGRPNGHVEDEEVSQGRVSFLKRL
jgi:hypothetical protein